MSDKDKRLDAEELIAWAQLQFDSFNRIRIDSNGQNMYAAGAAKAYEATIQLLKLGAFTKKETYL